MSSRYSAFRGVWVSVPIVAGVVAILVFDQTVGLAIVAAIGCCALLILAPRALFMLAVVATMMSSSIAIFLPLFATVDDVAVAVAVLAGAMSRVRQGHSLRSFPGISFFGLFLACGVLSHFISSPSMDVSLFVLASFTALKGIILGFAAAQFDWDSPNLRAAVFAVGSVAALCLAGAVANLSFGERWVELFAPGVSLKGGWGLPALVGPFARPAALSRISALLAVLSLALFLTFWLKKLHRLLALSVFCGLTIVVGVSAVSKSELALLAGAIILVALIKGRYLAFIGSIFTGALVAAFFLPAVQGVLDDVQRYSVDSSARSRLLAGGLLLAKEHWPLGVGFGLYGSPGAASNYSPFYSVLGFERIFGLAPTSPFYLNDTAWPAVVGEAGWAGLILFIGGLLAMAVFLFKGWREAGSEGERIVCALGLAWIAMIMVESSSGPVFTSPPAFGLVFAITGIAKAMRFERGGLSLKNGERLLEVSQ